MEFLRLTAFLHPEERPIEPTWWADVTNVQPEQRTSKPARGEFQDSGLLGTANLSLSVLPGRVDWLLFPGPFEPTVDLVAVINSVGLFPDQFGDFIALMGRWLRNAPRILRLAFGAVVLDPVDSKEAGYRKLADYLPGVQINSAGSEDFLYQINRPRTSRTIPALRVNRLSKWSVAYFQRFRLGMLLPSAQLGDRTHACRIELDMSTPVEHLQALPGDRLGDLFRELADLAAEVVSSGDIP